MSTNAGQASLFGDDVAVGYNAPLYPASRITLSSGSEDWFTPPEVLDVVRKFDAIAFDPFDNARSLVGASEFVRRPDCSLVRDWPRQGLIFCNPPYGEAPGECARKIGAEARRGSEIITVVPARLDTVWWQDSLCPELWCAWRGRITFLETVEALQARYEERVQKAKQSGQRPPKAPRFEVVGDGLARGETATFAAALCYAGPRLERFARIFAEHGKIYKAVAHTSAPGHQVAPEPMIEVPPC